MHFDSITFSAFVSSSDFILKTFFGSKKSFLIEENLNLVKNNYFNIYTSLPL